MVEIAFLDHLESIFAQHVGEEKAKKLLEKRGLAPKFFSASWSKDPDEKICERLRQLNRLYRYCHLLENLLEEPTFIRTLLREFSDSYIVSYFRSGKMRRKFVNLLPSSPAEPFEHSLFRLAYEESKNTEEIVIKDLFLAMCYDLVYNLAPQYDDPRRLLSILFRFPVSAMRRLASYASLFSLLDRFNFKIYGCLFQPELLKELIEESSFKQMICEFGFPDEPDLWRDFIKFIQQLQVKFFLSYDWSAAPFWLVLSSEKMVCADFLNKIKGTSHFRRLVFTYSIENLGWADVKSEIVLDDEKILENIVKAYGFYPTLDQILSYLKRLLEVDFYWWRAFLDRELGRDGVISISLKKNIDPEKMIGKNCDLLELLESILPSGFVVDLDKKRDYEYN